MFLINRNFSFSKIYHGWLLRHKIFRDLYESLNFSTEALYHTGIKRDANTVWRRSSDGAEVKLSGWYPGHPSPNPKYNVLFWVIINDENQNKVLSYEGSPSRFICESEVGSGTLFSILH